MENKYPDSSIYINLNCDVYENKSFTNSNNCNHYILNKKNKNKIYLDVIKGPFIKNHFYYVNNNMCHILINNLKVMTYQLDIELGLLAEKLFSIGVANVKFKCFCNDIIIQDKDFNSDIQFYCIHFYELSTILEKYNIEKNIIQKIFDYIPNVFKMYNCRLFQNRETIKNKLIDFSEIPLYY